MSAPWGSSVAEQQEHAHQLGYRDGRWREWGYAPGEYAPAVFAFDHLRLAYWFGFAAGRDERARIGRAQKDYR